MILTEPRPKFFLGEGRFDVSSLGPFIPGRCFPLRNFRVEDATFDGAVSVPSVRGIGTGHGTFTNVAFHNGGVIFGTQTRNANAADCTFNKCYFRDCDAAIQTTTSQNINYVFRDCFFKNCETIFRANGGGNVRFDNCFVIECQRLIHVPSSTNGNVLGSQNSDFIVDSMRFDQKQKNSFCLVHDQSFYGQRRMDLKRVIFSPGQFSKPKNYDLVQIERGSSWSFESPEIRNATAKVNDFRNVSVVDTRSPV